MAIYIGGLIVQVVPALDTDSDVTDIGTVSMAVGFVALVPRGISSYDKRRRSTCVPVLIVVGDEIWRWSNFFYCCHARFECVSV